MPDNLPQIYEFDGTPIRTVIGPDGEPWFIHNDYCRVVEIANPYNALKVVPDRWKALHPIETPGGVQNMTIVSELGMYKVLMRSDKPKAQPFQDWIVEVIRSIRKTGSYSIPAAVPAVSPITDSPLVMTLQAALEVARRQDQVERQMAVVATDHRALAIEVEATRKELEFARAEVVEARAEAERVRRDFTGSAGWFCLVTWAETKGIKLGPGQDGAEGRRATALCTLEGIEPRKIQTTRFPGGVNAYPEAILHKWRWDYLRRTSSPEAQNA